MRASGGTILASLTEDEGSIPLFISIIFLSIYSVVENMLGLEVTKIKDTIAKIHIFATSQELI